MALSDLTASTWPPSGTGQRRPRPTSTGLPLLPNAFAVAAGLPEISGAVASNLEEVGTVEIPGLDLTIQTCLWGSTSSRATWASYGVMFGAAKGDVTAFTCIVTS